MTMYPLNSPVAKKLVWWFIAISTIVALFSTGLQLYLDYRSEVGSIESYLSSLDETYLPSIAENTWIMDDNQVNTLLKGITNRDDIIYAAVSIDDAVQWSSGHKTDVDRFKAQLPIQYLNRNRLEHIGTLTVVANLEKVYQQLTRRALIVLFSNAVKTFIVAALALAAVQYLITRHLQAMSAHVSRMTVDKQHPPLRLDRKEDRQPDELDAVAHALSSMQERGYSAYREVLGGEQQLRLFLNSTEEGVFGIDSDGIVLFANTKCVQLLQLTAEEDIVGKKYSDLFHCRGLKKQAQIEDTGLLDTVMEGRTFFCKDSHISCSSDNGFYAEVRAYPTFSERRCSGGVVFFCDTSGQRELRHQMELLKEALDNSPISVVITDKDLNFVYVNPGFETLTGYSLDEITGKKIDYLSDDGTLKQAYQAATKQTLRGSAWQGRVRFRNKAGENRVVDVATSPISNELGQITNLVAVSRDVTYEEELISHLVTTQKQNALGRLSSSIAHEFGNPLLGIRALLKDFRDRSVLSSEDNTLLNIAISECGRMQDLIGDIQNLYGAQNTARTFCDIKDIISKVLFFQQKTFLDNNIVPTVIHNNELPVILGKEDQLAQVILNLILNGIEAMKPKGGTLIISSGCDRDFLNLDITDTGSGINGSVMDRIFEPFFTTKPEVEGTGLGLSVSYGIIAAHGGTITCQSTEGSGSTFTIHLPVYKSSKPEGLRA